MKQLHAVSSTSIGDMVLFWPETLPDNTVERVENDVDLFLQEMESASKIINLPTSGETGTFTLTVVFDREEVKKNESEYKLLTSGVEIEARGDCYFGGIEHLHPNEPEITESLFEVIDSIAILDGTYQVTVYGRDIPEDQLRNRLRERTGLGVYRLITLLDAMRWAVGWSLMGALLSIFLFRFEITLAICGFAILTLIAFLLLSELKSIKTAMRLIDEFYIEHAHFIVVLERQSSL